MRILLTIVLCLSALFLHAQEGSDIIYLKDGAIYKGIITEYIPNDHVILKLLDGRIITLPVSNIQSMAMGRDEIIKNNFDIKQKGYFHNSLGGFQLGKSENSRTQVGVSYNMLNGYRLNNHHMGLGLGIENHAGNWYLPLYADYSYHILKRHFSPVIALNGGWMAPLNAPNGSRYDYTRGSFMGGRIGFVAYQNPHFAFLLNITYRYIHLSGAEYTYFPLWEDFYEVTGSAKLHRVGLMLGFVIN